MDKKGYLYLGISIFVFSTIEIAAKLVVNDFHPLQMSFLRFFLAGLALIPFALVDMKKRDIRFDSKDMVLMSLLGIISVPISTSFYQMSLYYTKASILAVLISSNALFVAPFSYLILKEKIDKAVVISLSLGLVGMFIIANPASSVGSSDTRGIMYGIAGSVTFGLYTVLGKKVISKYGGLILNCMVFLTGSLFLLPVLLYVKAPIFSGISSSNIFNILYMSIIVNALGYVLLFKGLSLLPASKGSLIFFVKPGLAGLFAYLVLKETFSPNLVIGTLFISAGILFTVLRGAKPSLKKIEAAN